MFSQKNLHLNKIALLAGSALASLNVKNRLRRRFCFSLVFFLLFLPLMSVAQTRVKEEWVARYNGPGNDRDLAYNLTLDSSGNVYATGFSEGGKTQHDYATIKYDQNGNQMWIVRYNGPGNGHDEPAPAYALAVDDSGNVYVTGFSKGGETQYDYATIKYDNNGNQIWVRRYNGPGNGYDSAYALTLDDSGNVYVIGYSDGDYATIKYDTNGNQIWVARYNGPGNDDDFAFALALDDSGNVYVTGGSYGIRTLYDYATIKYDNNGNQIWVARYRRYRYYGPDVAYALALDDSGNIYVTGLSIGRETYEDYATIKYDNNGNQIWVAIYDGAKVYDVAYAIDVDSLGNVYVTGYSIGHGTGNDYATIKYDTNGNQIWVARYNGPGNDSDIAYALALDDSGNVYVTGLSVGKETYEDCATIKYDNNGNQIWVARYNGPVNSKDWAYDIALDDSGNVYVTGLSVGRGTLSDYVTIKYSQQPSPTVVCKTDKDIYNSFDKVQVLADVNNPSDGFDANLIGGIIVIRTPPKKPIILAGEPVTETIDPGLNPDILLYESPAIITAIAPKTTHGAFCILYTDDYGILAIDTSTWGLEPPLAAQDEFFDNLIRSYIDRYGLENLQDVNAE